MAQSKDATYAVDALAVRSLLHQVMMALSPCSWIHARMAKASLSLAEHLKGKRSEEAREAMANARMVFRCRYGLNMDGLASGEFPDFSEWDDSLKMKR